MNKTAYGDDFSTTARFQGQPSLEVPLTAIPQPVAAHDGAACVKCSTVGVMPSYHAGRTDCVWLKVKTDGEHLHYLCRCGYEWTTPTDDSNGTLNA